MVGHLMSAHWISLLKGMFGYLARFGSSQSNDGSGS